MAHALSVGRSLVKHLAGQVERLAIASRLHEQIEPAGTHAQVRTHEHGIPRVGHGVVVERRALLAPLAGLGLKLAEPIDGLLERVGHDDDVECARVVAVWVALDAAS